MRRVILFAFVVFCAWVAGCTSFITQSRPSFFSRDNGPNADAFDGAGDINKSAKEETPAKK